MKDDNAEVHTLHPPSQHGHEAVGDRTHQRGQEPEVEPMLVTLLNIISNL